jgi:cell division protein FtsI (penicillin-binding protein 3)
VTEELGSRRAPFVLLVVALLVGTTLGLLILNTAIAVDSLKATELRAANAERAEQVQHLEQQVVSGGAPARIADAAGKAGLVPAGPAAFLVIADDGSSTLRGTPEPAEAPPAPPAPASPAPGAAQVPAPAAAGTAGG